MNLEYLIWKLTMLRNILIEMYLVRPADLEAGMKSTTFQKIAQAGNLMTSFIISYSKWLFKVNKFWFKKVTFQRFELYSKPFVRNCTQPGLSKSLPGRIWWWRQTIMKCFEGMC